MIVERQDQLVVTPEYVGPERRKEMHMTPEQVDRIAELAAAKAVDKTIEKLTKHVYAEVGKTVVHKVFWLIGVGAVGLYVWLRHIGVIK